MNLHALKVFCEVVRLQSFSRGAAACGISQSAASQLIRHLEEELDTQLIERKVRPPRATSEGEIYYRGGQELLRRHELIIDEMRRLRHEVAGEFRIASIYSVGLHMLTRRTRRFMAEHPATEIRLEYLHPEAVYTAVLKGDAEIGVTSYPRLTRGLIVSPWLEEEMVLVCNPEHPLARQETVKPSDLSGRNFVSFVSDLPIRREVDRVLRQHQINVEEVGEFDNIDTIKQAVELAPSVSILPRACVEREVARGTLVGLPLEKMNLRRPVGILHKKSKKLIYPAVRFIETLLSPGDGAVKEPREASAQ